VVIHERLWLVCFERFEGDLSDPDLHEYQG